MTSATADKLLGYPWPGNVRELQNCIERAVALSQFDQIGVDDLPEKIKDYKTARIGIESNDPSELLPMEEVERRYILKVLESVGGNKTLAAQVLGFDRRTLYRKLERVRDPAHREHRAAERAAAAGDDASKSAAPDRGIESRTSPGTGAARDRSYEPSGPISALDGANHPGAGGAKEGRRRRG